MQGLPPHCSGFTVIRSINSVINKSPFGNRFTLCTRSLSLTVLLQHPQFRAERLLDLVQDYTPDHLPVEIDSRETRHPRAKQAIGIVDRQLDAVCRLVVPVGFALAADLRDDAVKDLVGEGAGLTLRAAHFQNRHHFV